MVIVKKEAGKKKRMNNREDNMECNKKKEEIEELAGFSQLIGSSVVSFPTSHHNNQHVIMFIKLAGNPALLPGAWCMFLPS